MDRVAADVCGHWTTLNDDGSVPMFCDFCLLNRAEGSNAGALPASPAVRRFLLEAPAKILRRLGSIRIRSSRPERPTG